MMDYSQYLPYAATIFIAIPFLIYFRNFSERLLALKEQELKLIAAKSGGENRTVAYERMTLFLERLKPANLVAKFGKDLEPHEFLFLTEKSITEEFEYNASQQLFISKNSWQNIVNAKNSVIQLAHKTYEELKGEATLDDFKTIFLMKYMNGEDYISYAIDSLRKDTLLLNK